MIVMQAEHPSQPLHLCFSPRKLWLESVAALDQIQSGEAAPVRQLWSTLSTVAALTGRSIWNFNIDVSLGMQAPYLRVEEELPLVVCGRAAGGAGALGSRRAVRRLPQGLKQRQRPGPLAPGACASGRVANHYHH